MTHSDHVFLLEKAISKRGGKWADFGSGQGAFTLAIRDLAGQDCKIFSIDKNVQALEKQQQAFARYFPDSNVSFINGDFTYPLDLPKLDGIVMANSLHFLRNKKSMLRHARTFIKEKGIIIIVEYNDRYDNQWVPYPVPFGEFTRLIVQCGFSEPQLLATVPSRFMNEIYSACAIKISD